MRRDKKKVKEVEGEKLRCPAWLRRLNIYLPAALKASETKKEEKLDQKRDKKKKRDKIPNEYLHSILLKFSRL